MKPVFLYIICVCYCSSVSAQPHQAPQTKVPLSVLAFEKIYTHTNKTLFNPGETIYFNTFLTDAQFKSSTQSKFIYASLVAPNGETISERKFKINKISSRGSFSIPKDAVGGAYKIRVNTPWQRSDGQFGYEKDIHVIRTVTPQLLMKLEVEREAYGPGDLVQADLSIKDLHNAPISHLDFDYEVYIGGEQYLSKTDKVSSEGQAQIRFTLPDSLHSDFVSLNVLFNHNLYKESITRRVPIVVEDIDLQFLPEGGFMLAGFPNTIAFKAINKAGNPADVSGIIVDSNGREICPFTSFHQGMGKVLFTPESGQSYFAKITAPYTSSDLIALPLASSRGFVINLTPSETENQVNYQVLSSQKSELTLRIRSECNVYHRQSITVQPGINRFTVSTADFPAGILSISVSRDNHTISERLFFNKPNDQLRIKVTPDKERYQSREAVTLQILTTDQDDQPVPSLISLSVVDDKLLSYLDDKQHNILSWMLMGTHLKGSIYEPAFYFDTEKEKRHDALDLVLLTHGWRNYDWQHLLAAEKKNSDPYTDKNTIYGRVTLHHYLSAGSKPYETTVYVIADSLLYTTRSNKDGYFAINTIPTDTWQVFAKRQSLQGYLHIEQIRDQGVIKKMANEWKVPSDTSAVERIAERTDAPQTMATERLAGTPDVSAHFGNQEVEEVVVTGFGNNARRSLSGAQMIASHQANEMTASTSVSILSGAIAGVAINPSNEHANSPIIIRGTNAIGAANNPLIVVDGIVHNPSNLQNFSHIDPSSIKSIEILKDAAATAIYGARGANGVIVIRTKGDNAGVQGRVSGKFQKLFYTPFYGSSATDYHTADQFYFPKYENQQVSVKDDFRDNIYWNYHIETDQDGQASVSYYNADDHTSYRILSEGIGTNGTVGRTEDATYSVADNLIIDAKLPLYASVDDVIEVPVHVQHHYQHNVHADLSISTTGSLSPLDSSTQSILLQANQPSLQHIPFKVVKPSEGNEKIRFLLSSGNEKNGILRDVTLFEKGFPFEYGKSTTSSATYEIDIKSAIPNTQSLHINLYLTPVKQIIDGLARIVREPHGCFEQVSSSVYPNIYALSILQLMNQSPDLQSKIKGYLRTGYKKLAAYEISGGGFELFGKKPATEVLSAFGLVEFVEMSPYIAVDPKMLDRTKEWLLSRRDGNGGYQYYPGKFGYYNNRTTVSNAYITYALSLAGATGQIEAEYQMAKTEAQHSKDPYRVALIALTAHELNRQDDYQEMITLLSQQLPKLMENAAYSAESSITHSRGKSLRVETLAWMALAFEKQNRITPELSACIEEIIQHSNNGYFGSTQATGLGLKAITGYFKLILASIKNDGDKDLWVKVNGEPILSHKITTHDTPSWNIPLHLPDGRHYITFGLEGIDFAILSSHFNYQSSLPPDSEKALVKQRTSLSSDQVHIGQNLVLKVGIQNTQNLVLPMTTSKIGIPGGLSPEPKQLRELMENDLVDYYELFDNFLVLYWRELGPREVKNITLDLKAQIPGTYQGSASSTYLYYTEEYKHWNEGLKIRIRE